MANPTIVQVVERTYKQIARSLSQEAANLYRFEIESWIKTACQNMAEQAVKGDPALRTYLTASYGPISPSGGIYSLAGATFSDMMFDSLQGAILTSSEAEKPWKYVPNVQDLYYPQPGVDFICYGLENETIRAALPGSTIDTCTAQLTIRNAVFVPVVGTTSGTTTLPEQLEDDLVNELVGMAQKKMGAITTTT